MLSILDIDFINSPFREVYIPITIVVIVLSFQICLFFWMQWYTIRKKSKETANIFLALGLFIFMLALALIPITLERFFLTSEQRDIPNQLKYIFITIGFLFCTYNIERVHLNLFKTKYIFTILTIIALPFIIIIPSGSNFYLIALSVILLDALFLVIFYLKIARRSIGRIKFKIYSMLFGFFITIIGISVGSDMLVMATSNEILLIVGYILFFIGILVIYISLYDVSIFLESDWKENLINLHIIDLKSNKCMYFQDFQQKPASNVLKSESKSLEEKKELFSGGLVGIQSVISAITDSIDPNLKTILLGNTHILLDYGDGYICSFLVQKPMDSLFFFLREISNQFKHYFGSVISTWNGNSETFLPMKAIISKTLTQKES